jgi:glycogen(starch) synthase
MNILLMPSAFYPSLGGVEELTAKLAAEYEGQGHTVLIMTNRWPKSLPRWESVGSLNVCRIPYLLPDTNVKVLIRFMLLVPLLLVELTRVINRFRPSVLHVVCCSVNLPYAYVFRRVLGIPLVVTAQGEIGMDAAGLYQSTSFVPRHFRKFLERASWVTACSSDTRRELLEYSTTARCEVVHNGIDLNEFRAVYENPRFGSGRPYVFAMGRHVYQKGFDVLIRAWHQLQLHDYDLVIGGSGTDTEHLRELINELNVENSVHLVGRLDRGGVVAHLQHATCFVLPSRHEPFGIVVLEAMAAKIPVIATMVGGVPEFVMNGRNGRLVKGNDVKALESALSDLLSQGVDETQVNAAYATAVAHEWSAIANEYLNIYSKCIAGEVQV